jgi:hypothetical protein
MRTLSEGPGQAGVPVGAICRAHFLHAFVVMDGAHKRTLERALKVLQPKERLAVALELPLKKIDSYMAGEKPLPHKALITAIDIVAKGEEHSPPRYKQA